MTDNQHNDTTHIIGAPAFAAAVAKLIAEPWVAGPMEEFTSKIGAICTIAEAVTELTGENIQAMIKQADDGSMAPELIITPARGAASIHDIWSAPPIEGKAEPEQIATKALLEIIERSNNHELGTGKVPDMRAIAEKAIVEIKKRSS